MGSVSHEIKLTWQKKTVFSRCKIKNKEETAQPQSNVRKLRCRLFSAKNVKEGK